MKGLLTIVLVLFMCTVLSCTTMDYAEWEVSVKYDLIYKSDTLHFYSIDTVSHYSSYAPVAIMTPDSSAIIVRFMDNTGEFIPNIEYKENRVIYQHSTGNLNLVSFNNRKLRNKKVSKFSGHEITPEGKHDE